MKQLDEFLNHKEPLIASAAMGILSSAKLVEAGEMSKSEYEELVGDLTELAQINDLADNVERKATLERALTTLKSIALKLI